MADKCCGDSKSINDLASRQAKVLWIVFAINLVMFFLEFIYGWIANSTALIGDSLDMLGDVLAYGSSLIVVNKGLSSKVIASKFKAYTMVVLGLLVLSRAIYRFIFPTIPEVELMTIVGFTALIANLVCLFLLTRHKDDDINFKSVWVCSRNDIIANVSVLCAALLVYKFHTPLPDLLVGFGITFLFIKSASGILREAKNLAI